MFEKMGTLLPSPRSSCIPKGEDAIGGISMWGSISGMPSFSFICIIEHRLRSSQYRPEFFRFGGMPSPTLRFFAWLYFKFELRGAFIPTSRHMHRLRSDRSFYSPGGGIRIGNFSIKAKDIVLFPTTSLVPSGGNDPRNKAAGEN